MDKTNFTLEEIRENCSEVENLILDMYLNRKKQKEIIEKLSVTRSKIDHFVAKYKLTRFRSRNNYCLDEETIDVNNPEYWYFLGFFAADGNVHLTNSGSEIVQFTLKDREPLEDIITILKYSGEIKEYTKQNDRKYYFLGITNKKLIESIREIFGEIYRKTSILTYPKIPNKDCESMFLRGYWDGDGCFTLSNNRRTYIGECYCESKDFLEGFKSSLETYDIHYTAPESRILLTSKDGLTDFINFIYGYSSSLGLPRKRGLAMLHLYYTKNMI